jgi:hypothetical protein
MSRLEVRRPAREHDVRRAAEQRRADREHEVVLRGAGVARDEGGRAPRTGSGQSMKTTISEDVAIDAMLAK